MCCSAPLLTVNYCLTYIIPMFFFITSIVTCLSLNTLINNYSKLVPRGKLNYLSKTPNIFKFKHLIKMSYLCSLFTEVDCSLCVSSRGLTTATVQVNGDPNT